MNEKRNHSIAGVFVYLLLGIFAVMSLALVLLGIRTYSAAATKTAGHNTERILTNYVRTVLRGSDRAGVVYTEEAAGLTVLTVRDEDEESVYFTRLYCYGGRLMEQFTSDEIEFEPENGESLCDCAGFVPTVEPGLATLRFTDSDGTEKTVYVALRAGQ